MPALNLTPAWPAPCKHPPASAITRQQVNHLVSQGELWRLLTPALVHGGLFHLGMNLVALHFIGPAVEAALGPRRFAAVYAASAITGNALAWAMQTTGFSMAVGASSSISGLFGAYGELFRARAARAGPRGRGAAEASAAAVQGVGASGRPAGAACRQALLMHSSRPPQSPSGS
jgi:membrane associated rhomboid family serine protease